MFSGQMFFGITTRGSQLVSLGFLDEDQAERLAKQLHALLIDQNPRSRYLSKSWQEEFGQYVERETPWWETKREALLALAERESPLYVYNRESVDKAAKKLLDCDAIDQVFYAIRRMLTPIF